MSIIRLSDEEVFTTDSSDYEILERACLAVKDVPGAIVEIGTRRGGSAKLMMDTLARNHDSGRPFFCIDPYGNIETQLTNLNIKTFYSSIAKIEGDPDSRELSSPVRLDYNNEMRNRVIPSLYYCAFQMGFQFTFFCLEDTEFFKRYGEGVPVYDQEKVLVNQYALAFLDGPHTNHAIEEEVVFFKNRMPSGGYIVFDDVWQYEHNEKIEPWLFRCGFTLIEKTDIKASYKKQ